MKILHCCLAAFYIDNYGYQENILPKIHKMQGHEVQILASTETYIKNKKLGYIKPSSYSTSDGILITRIPYISSIPHLLSKKIRAYKGITKILNSFNPDIIFLHDIQFIGIKEIAKYAKQNNVEIFADCHTDFINSARSWISKNILHKIIYKWCAKKIEPYTKVFFGTLPTRGDFLKDVYGISSKKIDILPFGADDSQFDIQNKNATRKKIREQYNLKNDDFVLITGGKIDRRKNIHLLLKAIENIKHERIKLILFGTISDDLVDEVNKYKTNSNIIFIDWIKPDKIYELLFAADLAFFPGTHSVLWEQCIGVGLPCVFKKWDGIQHVDLGGNCVFLKDDSITSIKNTIIRIVEDPQLYNQLKLIAIKKGIPNFTYSKIAKKAIGH